MSVSDKLNTNEQQLLIDGMHCAACVKRVEKALNKVNGVNFASVNLVDQIAFVQGDAQATSLVQAVEKLGFHAEMLESEESRRAKQQAQTARTLSHKKWQFRVALGVGAGLMLLGFIIGMHLNENNRFAWWLAAFISLATMYFAGKDFFKGAWMSLKNGAANMDTLVALSTGVAWLYSFSHNPMHHSISKLVL